MFDIVARVESMKYSFRSGVVWALKLGTAIVILEKARHVGFILGAVIHESGHAMACMAEGGSVGNPRNWVRGVLTDAPATNCSIQPIPLSDWAAGPVMSIAAWFASVLIAGVLAKRASTCSVPFRLLCIWCWCWWSYWFLKTLWNNVVHSYSPPSLWEDTTQFVHRAGINPNYVAAPLAGIFAISVPLALFISYLLFPPIADLRTVFSGEKS